LPSLPLLNPTNQFLSEQTHRAANRPAVLAELMEIQRQVREPLARRSASIRADSSGVPT
jgi:hypothetical protein